MTEYWVSQAKHWCKVCKVWTGGHKSQILKHTQGRGHQEMEEKMLKEMREREKERKKEEKGVVDELAEIERKALAAMGMSPAPARTAAPTAFATEVTGPGAADPERLAQKRTIVEAVEFAKRRRGDVGGGKGSGASTAAPQAAATCPWTRHTDPNSGVYYYHNASTGESAWVQPADFVEPPAQPAGPAAAPAAASSSTAVPAAGDSASSWVVCTDPGSGQVYYFNKLTLASSWEKPADLAVDLSRPPPPPRKPPPPPKKRDEDKKGASAAPVIGGWEEVRPSESMWGRPEEIQAAAALPDSSDEEPAAVNPINDLKIETEKRRFAAEDLEVREKEFCQKKSNASFEPSKPVSFSFGGKKKAGGGNIRKRLDDD